MTHIARGLDSDGALLLDIVVSGYVLQLQSPAEVTVKVKCQDNLSLLLIKVMMSMSERSIEGAQITCPLCGGKMSKLLSL